MLERKGHLPNQCKNAPDLGRTVTSFQAAGICASCKGHEPWSDRTLVLGSPELRSVLHHASVHDTFGVDSPIAQFVRIQQQSQRLFDSGTAAAARSAFVLSDIVMARIPEGRIGQGVARSFEGCLTVQYCG